MLVTNTTCRDLLTDEGCVPESGSHPWFFGPTPAFRSFSAGRPGPSLSRHKKRVGTRRGVF